MNIVKVLLLRFERWFVLFTMLLFEVSSEMGLFTQWSNPIFQSPQFRKCVNNEVHLFLKKCSKFNLYFKKTVKNSDKIHSFWGNCIWIGCLKLSLLRREYLSSPANVLRNNLNILYITKRDFLQLNYLHSAQ